MSCAYGFSEITRGKDISKDALREFVTNLAIPQDAKDLLLAMTPANYLGIAEKLARERSDRRLLLPRRWGGDKKNPRKPQDLRGFFA